MRLLNYMLGGKATFTVRSLKTGKHYTYRINELDPAKIRGNHSSIHFIGVLSGNDNTSDYVNIATMFSRRHLRPTGSATTTTPSYAAFEWVIETLWWHSKIAGVELEELPNCDFIPSGRCCRCGRLLTTPESVSAGIGPECAEKASAA